MKKEYVTCRLFKNNRSEDCVITEEKSQESDQKASSEDLTENRTAVVSYENSNKSSLPQRVLRLVKKAFVMLYSEHKS
jgi:hypothetical protein